MVGSGDASALVRDHPEILSAGIRQVIYEALEVTQPNSTEKGTSQLESHPNQLNKGKDWF